MIYEESRKRIESGCIKQLGYHKADRKRKQKTGAKNRLEIVTLKVKEVSIIISKRCTAIAKSKRKYINKHYVIIKLCETKLHRNIQNEQNNRNRNGGRNENR